MWWTKKKRVEPDYSLRDKHQQFYQTGKWKRLRLYKLSINPLCELCLPVLKPATVVDHIQSLSDRYDLRLSLSNTQSLCAICHNRKSSIERWQYHQERQQKEVNNRMDELEDM